VPQATVDDNNPTSPTSRASGAICEVWALTGFCKFGQKCWKEHPKFVDVQLDQNVAEPVTKKFQEWLQSRSQPLSPDRRSGSSMERNPSFEHRSPMQRADSWNSIRSPITSPTRGMSAPAFSAQEYAQAQELLVHLERFHEVVPSLVQLVNSGRLTLHSLMPMLHSTAVRASITPNLYARCAAQLRDEFPGEAAKCERLLCSLVHSMAMNALSNFFPTTMDDYQSCLRNAAFLGDLYLFGIAKEKEMDEFLQLLLLNFEKHTLERQDLRVQMLCQVLTASGYQMRANEHRRIQALTQEVKSPETLRSLWALLATIPPPALMPVSVGRPFTPTTPFASPTTSYSAPSPYSPTTPMPYSPSMPYSPAMSPYPPAPLSPTSYPEQHSGSWELASPGDQPEEAPIPHFPSVESLGHLSGGEEDRKSELFVHQPYGPAL